MWVSIYDDTLFHNKIIVDPLSLPIQCMGSSRQKKRPEDIIFKKVVRLPKDSYIHSRERGGRFVFSKTGHLCLCLGKWLPCLYFQFEIFPPVLYLPSTNIYLNLSNFHRWLRKGEHSPPLLHSIYNIYRIIRHGIVLEILPQVFSVYLLSHRTNVLSVLVSFLIIRFLIIFQDWVFKQVKTHWLFVSYFNTEVIKSHDFTHKG